MVRPVPSALNTTKSFVAQLSKLGKTSKGCALCPLEGHSRPGVAGFRRFPDPTLPTPRFRSFTALMSERLSAVKVRQCYSWGMQPSALNFHSIHEWIVKPATRPNGKRAKPPALSCHLHDDVLKCFLSAREYNSSMMEHLSDRKLVPNWSPGCSMPTA